MPLFCHFLMARNRGDGQTILHLFGRRLSWKARVPVNGLAVEGGMGPGEGYMRLVYRDDDVEMQLCMCEGPGTDGSQLMSHPKSIFGHYIHTD